ncbi:hypothetical protein [Sorangium sp. So ce1097]|uniref:hypothetical protein n=1 Tax=Sorangium sp. So ce1097 TaxID=3133330 RepID=UPI003F625480
MAPTSGYGVAMSSQRALLPRSTPAASGVSSRSIAAMLDTSDLELHLRSPLMTRPDVA